MIRYKIDAVILTYTADNRIFSMTQEAINSLIVSASNFDLNIVVVETENKTGREYQNCIVICPNEQFNFNRFLNIGISFTRQNSDFVLLLNNDIVCYPDWLDKIINKMNINSLDSACPRSPGWQFHSDLNDISYLFNEYSIGRGLTGWALVFKTDSLLKVFPFDEDFVFWCGDNYLAEQMQKLNFKHALIGESKIEHLTNRSHRLVPRHLFDHYTNGMVRVLNQKLEKNKGE